MKSFVLTTLAAALLVAGGANATTNLLTNGSFESGLDHWTLSGSALDAHPAVVISYNSTAGYPVGAFGEPVPADLSSGNISPDTAGTHAAYFVSDFSNETLTQSIWLDPGLYEIGFSAYAPLNGYNNAYDAHFGGEIAGVTLVSSSLYSVHGNTPQSWQWFSGTANIVTAGNYDATFTFSTNGNPAADMVIDRAYVISAAPEPAAWAMLLIGFGMIGVMMRSGRRAALTA